MSTGELQSSCSSRVLSVLALNNIVIGVFFWLCYAYVLQLCFIGTEQEGKGWVVPDVF